jgi:hypothetical protein
MLLGHDPRSAADVHRHHGQIPGRAASVADRNRKVGRIPEQPQGLIAREPARGCARGQAQAAHPPGPRFR